MAPDNWLFLRTDGGFVKRLNSVLVHESREGLMTMGRRSVIPTRRLRAV